MLPFDAMDAASGVVNHALVVQAQAGSTSGLNFVLRTPQAQRTMHALSEAVSTLEISIA